MARKKKTLLPGLAECMKPLDSSKHVSMYIAAHNTNPGHNKIYIFVVAVHKKHTYLARFWGKYGAALTGMYDLYDQEVFQKLIDEKGTEGYKILDNAAFAADEHIWAPYAEQIANFVKLMPSNLAGDKMTIT